MGNLYTNNKKNLEKSLREDRKKRLNYIKDTIPAQIFWSFYALGPLTESEIKNILAPHYKGIGGNIQSAIKNLNKIGYLKTDKKGKKENLISGFEAPYRKDEHLKLDSTKKDKLKKEIESSQYFSGYIERDGLNFPTGPIVIKTKPNNYESLKLYNPTHKWIDDLSINEIIKSDFIFGKDKKSALPLIKEKDLERIDLIVKKIFKFMLFSDDYNKQAVIFKENQKDELLLGDINFFNLLSFYLEEYLMCLIETDSVEIKGYFIKADFSFDLDEIIDVYLLKRAIGNYLGIYRSVFTDRLWNIIGKGIR